MPGMKPGPDSIGIVAISHGCPGVAAGACGLVGLEPTRVAELLKDRPLWFRDCRAVDVLSVLPTASGGTIELLYMQALRQLRQIAQEVSQPNVTGWGQRPAALQALSQRLSRGFNEALNGFTDDGCSMMRNDGMNDVTVLVNSSPEKLMGLNLSFANGFPAVNNGLMC